jgi:hypothetical protein
VRLGHDATARPALPPSVPRRDHQLSCSFSIGWDAKIHPDFVVWLIAPMRARAVGGGTERRLIML